MFSDKIKPIIMFKYITLVLLFSAILITHKVTAQKIYSVDAAYKADIKVYVADAAYKADLLVYKEDAAYKATDNKGRWFFTDAAYKADKKVYFVDASYKADLIIFFVDAEYKAKWQKLDKIYYLY